MEFEERSKVKKKYFTKELLKCVLKTLVIGLGFLIINHDKYSHVAARGLETIFGSVLYIFLYFPSLLMTVSSHRYYVGTTFVGCFLEKITDQMEKISFDLKKANKFQNTLKRLHSQRTFIKNLNFLTKTYTELHDIFFEFNEFYGRNILLIFKFCFFNIIFELYFFYLNIAMSLRFEIKIDISFAFFVGFQIFFYFLEIYLTIDVYENLREIDERFGRVLQRMPSYFHGAVEKQVCNGFES
jgi:hypothetical protein